MPYTVNESEVKAKASHKTKYDILYEPLHRRMVYFFSMKSDGDLSLVVYIRDVQRTRTIPYPISQPSFPPTILFTYEYSFHRGVPRSLKELNSKNEMNKDCVDALTM